MSVESQQRGLFVVVRRKRERSPSSDRSESLLLAPPTPPAAEKKRSFDDEEDWGVQLREWGENYVSEVQEPSKRSRNRLWWVHVDSLLLVDQDPNEASNFHEDSSSHLPFVMSTTDLSAEESCNIGTRSGLLALSQEDLEDIASAATPVTPLSVVSRPAGDKSEVVQQPPAIRVPRSGDPEDEGSSNLPGYSLHRLSLEETSVGSSP